jgi:hypothetical protein
MILCTSKQYSHLFRKLRGDRNITILEEEVDRTGLPIACPVKHWLSGGVWDTMVNTTKEEIPYVHNRMHASLLQLWLSKAWFVQRAIAKAPNQFPSGVCMWCDIGSVRSEEDELRVRGWPCLSKLQTSHGKLTLFARNHLPKGPWTESMCSSQSDPWIASSHMFGTILSWNYLFEDVYLAVVQNAILYGNGVYDATIYAKLVMTKPDRYTTIGDEYNTNSNWFQSYRLHSTYEADTMVIELRQNQFFLAKHNGLGNQLFTLLEHGEYYSLKCNNGLVMDASNGLKTSAYNGKDGQLFQLHNVQNGYGFLVNKRTGKVLDVEQNQMPEGSPIGLWVKNSNRYQQVCLEKVSSKYLIKLRGNYVKPKHK